MNHLEKKPKETNNTNEPLPQSNLLTNQPLVLLGTGTTPHLRVKQELHALQLN